MWCKTPSGITLKINSRKGLSEKYKRILEYNNNYNDVNRRSNYTLPLTSPNYHPTRHRRRKSDHYHHSMNEASMQNQSLQYQNDPYSRSLPIINTSINISNPYPSPSHSQIHTPLYNYSNCQTENRSFSGPGNSLEKNLNFYDADYYEYQLKELEIQKMKNLLENIASMIRLLQYSSPFLFTVVCLIISKKKANEWFVLIKCFYQLITYQVKDPFVIVTSPKRRKSFN